jgi:hypothetical protein
MTARRPTRLTTKLLASAALSLALGAAMLATSVPARAEEDLPIDRKIMRGIMDSLGLKRDGEGINYQERAPLVIPPARDLPPPERSDGVIAKNPAWPKDPDLVRGKLEADMDRNRNVSEEREREQNPLREDQLTPGPGQKRKPGRADGYEASPYGNGNPSPPSQLGSKLLSKMFKKDDDEEVGKFTGEPPRTSLTAPPVGYQTPSPDQPYGLGKAGPANPKDYYTTHVEGEGSR